LLFVLTSVWLKETIARRSAAMFAGAAVEGLGAGGTGAAAREGATMAGPAMADVFFEGVVGGPSTPNANTVSVETAHTPKIRAAIKQGPPVRFSGPFPR
jgi:hypothetical protein